MRLCVLSALFAGVLNGQGIERLDGQRLTPAAVDQIVEGRMRESRVTGLALAVLNRNEIAYVKTYGMRDAAWAAPLRTDTVMYGASFTKSAFAFMVMQLVEEGTLDLDRPVGEYLPKPWAEYEKWKELGEDPRAKLITARTLLSHTSGFANFRFLNPGEKLQMFFAPGERYAYSGEGINLLGFVVEHVTGIGVAELMRQRVFDRFEMKRTSMTWRDDFAENLAVGHDEQGKGLGHSKRISARAAGSMDTTIADVALFLRGVMRGEGMSDATKTEMLREQIRIRSQAQFPTLRQPEVDSYDGIKLGYGLGWGVFASPYGRAFFKEGHDDGWEHHFVCFPAKESCLVLMTNSSNGDEVFMDLLDELMADRSTPWRWAGYAPPKRGTGAPR